MYILFLTKDMPSYVGSCIYNFLLAFTVTMFAIYAIILLCVFVKLSCGYRSRKL